MKTTTAAATAARTILALARGKYKSVACLYAGDHAAATFLTLTADRDRPQKLFAKYHPAAVVAVGGRSGIRAAAFATSVWRPGALIAAPWPPG
jgi:hypothetical protein